MRWPQVARRYPDDKEATILYALVLSVNFDPNDKKYTNQLKAAGILEPIMMQQPQHPGVAHYLIHSYDYPPIAQQGLEAAKRYSKIAPDASHALHMPSHIFSRVGHWQRIDRGQSRVRRGGQVEHPEPGARLRLSRLRAPAARPGPRRGRGARGRAEDQADERRLRLGLRLRRDAGALCARATRVEGGRERRALARRRCLPVEEVSASRGDQRLRARDRRRLRRESVGGARRVAAPAAAPRRRPRR